MSENENPEVEEREKEQSEDQEQRREQRSDSRRRQSRGNNRPRPRRGRGRGRMKSYYCPKGKCFDYKDYDTLRQYISDVGKIKPRRQTGNCARCQRELAREIKRARHIALLPFVNRS